MSFRKLKSWWRQKLGRPSVQLLGCPPLHPWSWITLGASRLNWLWKCRVSKQIENGLEQVVVAGNSVCAIRGHGNPNEAYAGQNQQVAFPRTCKRPSTTQRGRKRTIGVVHARVQRFPARREHPGCTIVIPRWTWCHQRKTSQERRKSPRQDCACSPPQLLEDEVVSNRIHAQTHIRRKKDISFVTLS